MKKETKIILIITLGCIVMALTDGFWQPGYALKSAVKIFFFLGVPLIALRRNRSQISFVFERRPYPN
jgi:hypothetical protein